jgi:putative tryptophan/tyrosine transport system substrate-binding protein
MRRRQFMTLLAGLAPLGPRGARAQQPAMPVIGFLSSASNAPNVERTPPAFRTGLKEAGYTVGQNVTIELFLADGRYERLPALADEMVRRQVRLIVAAGGLASARAAKAATDKIPILFIAGFDPVKLGLVGRINRPGGNATGLSIYTTELLAKRLEFLRETMPHASLVALLVNPLSPVARIETDDKAWRVRADFGSLPSRRQARGTGEGVRIGCSRPRRCLADQRRSLLHDTSQSNRCVGGAPRSARGLSLAGKYAKAGGLMSYGPSLTTAYREIGLYAGRILKGANPGELPVQFPTAFELVINVNTAKALGLAIPETLLAAASKVIE